MAADEGGVVAQWPQLAGDRRDKVGMVAAGEIGAADRTLEQHVAHQRQLRLGMVEHHMARRVAGAVEHIEPQLAHAPRIAVGQPAVRLERAAGLVALTNFGTIVLAIGPRLLLMAFGNLSG